MYPHAVSSGLFGSNEAGDGSLDTVFGAGGVTTTTIGASSYASAIVVDSAGTILVGGQGTGADGYQQLAIIAYNGDGSLDTAFANGAIVITNSSGEAAYAMALESDGKLLVVGTTGNGSGESALIAQYNATDSTSLSLTYDHNGNTLTDENGITYTYDAWNRMVTATPQASAVYGPTYHEEYYTYNALGEQVTKLDGIQSGVGPVLVINDGNAQRSMIDSLTVVFPSPVTLSSGAFELSETGVGDLTLSWTNPSGDGMTWLLSLASCAGLTYGSLPNGTYTLTIDHADVSGYTMSSDQTYNFYRLYGDYYGEGTVGADDLALESADYGISSSSSKYLWYMDVNDDGVINFSELLGVSQDYGRSYTVTTAGPIFIGASTTEGVGSGKVLEGLSPREFYYTSQWQVIQETANNPGTGGMQTADQYVWGIAYVNELVLRDYDSDGSSSTGNYGISGSGLDQRLYALQDANYNVTALVGLVSGTWSVVERFTYTPYGMQTVLNASGAQTTDSYKWTYGFQGGAVDAVTGLILDRERYYKPGTGTWLTPDPTGAAGSGTNLYQMEDSNPIGMVDPEGTDAGSAGVEPTAAAWKAKELASAGIDGNAWNPSAGFVNQSAIVSKVYAYYKRVYQANNNSTKGDANL